MTEHKAEMASGVAYIASIGGMAIGDWLASNWFQLISALIMVATFITHLWFHSRKDRRERAQAYRNKEAHEAALSQLQSATEVLEDAAETHDKL